MIIDNLFNRKPTIVEGSAANDYFTRRKSEEERIAGTRAPAKNKKNPTDTDYSKRRAQEKKVEQGVNERIGDLRKFAHKKNKFRSLDKLQNPLGEEGVAEAGNKPVEKSYFGMGDTRTARELKTQMRGAGDQFVDQAAKEVGPLHSRVARMQGKLAKSELRKRSDHDRMATGTNEGTTDDPRFQKMMGNIQQSTPNPVNGYVAVSYASERPSKKIKGVKHII
jgi:hypothetical protein